MLVAAGDLDSDELARVAPSAGVRLHGHLDVTDAESLRSFVDRAEQELGPIDVMVNNAGIMPTGPLMEESDAVSRRILEVNTLGVVTGTKRALETMVPRRSGHVVNIASMAGIFYMSGVATYTASKWGVLGFTEAARFELADSGVDLTAILPGVVHTELSSGARESRLLRSVEASDIAAAVLACLERPRARVFVPRAGAIAARAFQAAPRRMADRMLTVAGGREAFLDGLDHAARLGYEGRARQS